MIKQKGDENMANAKSKLSAALLALILAAALSLALGITLAQPAFADDSKTLDKICFDGDSDYEWAHFYSVKGADATLSDLKITLLDKEGAVVPADAYDLQIVHTWYDEAQNKDLEEAVEAPYGIAASNRTEGFSEFIARATAKAGSDYAGSVDAHFYIVDSYSLNWICAEVDFAGKTKKDGWRMCDRFWVPLDALKDPTVKTMAGATLMKGTDYIVTYYKRADLDLDSMNTDVGDIIGPNALTEANKLPGLPTAAGGYVVTIDGKSPYYGSATLLLDVEGAPDGGSDNPPASDDVVEFGEYVVDGNTYIVTDLAAAKVALEYSKDASAVTVPAKVTLPDGKDYSVTGIGSEAFAGTSAKKVIVKTKALTKYTVVGSLEGSIVKVIKVSVGKKQNAKYVKKYKKIFTKKNAGKKVTVK